MQNKLQKYYWIRVSKKTCEKFDKFMRKKTKIKLIFN